MEIEWFVIKTCSTLFVHCVLFVVKRVWYFSCFFLLFDSKQVLVEDGQRRYREIGCFGFREISVRESIDQVKEKFDFISCCKYLLKSSYVLALK